MSFDEQPDGDPHGECALEIARLRKALEDANGMCRSAYQVAVREGRQTCWATFRDRLHESLERQHRVMFPENYEPDA